MHIVSLEDIHEIEKAVSGVMYLNSKTKWTGIAIITRKNVQNLQIKDIEIERNNLQNRLAHLQTVIKETLNIINIYCPADHDEKEVFFQELNEHLEIYQEKKHFGRRF